MGFSSRLLLAAATSLILGAALASPAAADEIRNPIAVFAGLDKITGRIIRFEAAIDETVQFGSLQIKPRVCYTKPLTETPQTVSFVQVNDVRSNHTVKRIFSGWMFAASPGLNGIEHPVYDVWLLDCKGGSKVTASTPVSPDLAKQAVAPGPTPKPVARAPAASTPKKRTAEPLRPAATTAPAFTGPPIEVGAAPGDKAPDSIDPPGPLPQSLRPRRRPIRRFYPSQDVPDDRNPY